MSAGATTARLPSVTSYPARALARLLQGGTLTHLIYLADTGCYRLSRDIFLLRQDGWPIVGTRVAQPVTDCGRPALRHYTHYRLTREQVRISPDVLTRFSLAVRERERSGYAEWEATDAAPPGTKKPNNQGTLPL